jgi:diguanylate cyclase (GGDEF)-like protein
MALRDKWSCPQIKVISMRSSENRKRLFTTEYIRFSRYSIFAAGAVHALFLALFFYFGVFPMVIFNIFSLLIYAYCLNILNSSVEGGSSKILGWLVYIEITSHAVFSSYYVGVHSGFHYYIGLLAVLPFLTFSDSATTRMVKVALIIISFSFLDAGLIDYIPPYILEQDHTYGLRIFNAAMFITSATLVSLFYAKASYDVRKKLEHVSTTDELTGLYNRRLFIHLAENELKEIKRNNSTVSIILLDIDNFKKINDKYGHKCGDLTLQNISDILRQTVRPKDIVSRWGGEEFLVLLPDTDIAHAEVVAERLRKNIENEPLVCQEIEFKVTATLGLVSNNAQEEQLDRLIEQADNAMYTGKSRGKNQYVIAR